MSTYRARASCPVCGTEEEIWFYKNTIYPLEIIQCVNCTLVYDPSDFVVNFLEMYQNVTISSQSTVTKANI